MAIYICSKCLFRFQRTGAAENCPDCGNINIRYATSEEVAEYELTHADLCGGKTQKTEEE